MTESALKCIGSLEAKLCDISLLWLVRSWDSLSRSDTGIMLRDFIEVDMGLSRRDVENSEFIDAVTAHVKGRHVDFPDGSRYMMAYRKQLLLTKPEVTSWPQPCMPFMIQVMNHGKPGPFVVFPSWHEGLLMYIRMCQNQAMLSPDGKVIPVKLCYEHQIPGVPSRIIIDCDAKLADFDGILTPEEIQDMMEGFPSWFYGMLRAVNAIDENTRLEMYRKNKCRANKISYHFITNILCNSLGDGKSLLKAIFIDTFREDIVQFKKTGVLSEHARQPGFFADHATMHGRNQFSMLFGGKPNEPLPRIDQVITFRGGEEKRHAIPWEGENHTADHPNALEMLKMACFSTMTRTFITINSRFTKTLNIVQQVIF